MIIQLTNARIITILSEEIYSEHTEVSKDRGHLYRKSARDTPKFHGIASTFAMFLHSMPDRVGHDV